MEDDNIVNYENENQEKTRALDFIRQKIEDDLAINKFGKNIVTRFPPEPNGYLHIGHAKAICFNFGLAEEYNSYCNLRFDDTNPSKEDDEYVQAIQKDIEWLGFKWGNIFFASDYFQQMYDYAVQLIKKGKAYVDDQTAEEIRVNRGTLTTPGKESPWRNRTIEENLDLFFKMKIGEFPDGSRVLRAKIDMASPNLNMRDPVMYRILHVEHHRQGNKWCLYPMYDWAHGLEDSIEGITHSLCSLEFENHRPLYNWFLDELEIYHPEQTEFARLNLTYTVMSKRKLLKLVQEKYVNDWDDPRMPTLSGMRRRGYPPQAIRNFCKKIGIAKTDSTIDFGLLEFCVREELNKTAQRIMAVLDPIKVVIENYPENQEEFLEAQNNPENPDDGIRQVPFSKELYIERDDFMENPPKNFYRLSIGKEVRLRYAYYITCNSVIKDACGNITEIRCTYDPETKGGASQDGRKVKATLHWVSAKHGIKAKANLFENLFNVENPEDVEEGQDFTVNVNQNSLKVIDVIVEPFAKTLKYPKQLQFERVGYFCFDTESTPNSMIFNRTVMLKDTWSKLVQKGQQ